ncbi:MAG: class I SAM-dependent methyltransferase [Leptospiraceae bacterium]|nr:class I SAM-dependent methyltransferase [Leptospiraceae bacterium]
MRPIPCDQCGAESFAPLFVKESSQGQTFQLVRCRQCQLVQVNPQPDLEAVAPYYAGEYFEKRSERGYDNYFSSALKQQINRVYGLNLRDLGFDAWEAGLSDTGPWQKDLQGLDRDGVAIPAPATDGSTRNLFEGRPPRCLDVGCAAGYFVEYMQSRGWQSEGIELSAHAARFGIEQLQLTIYIDDFLRSAVLQQGHYDMLSFWASIEHMHSPRRVLERCYELLRPGGRLLLSTCRWGLLARHKAARWRFMNVPEHLYFFSLSGIIRLAADCGLRRISHITYGSGFTSCKDAGWLYRAGKQIADPLVKWLDQGDMMALQFERSH